MPTVVDGASGSLAAFVVRGAVSSSMIASVLRPTRMRAALIMIFLFPNEDL
jgi:hypothetical protein